MNTASGVVLYCDEPIVPEVVTVPPDAKRRVYVVSIPAAPSSERAGLKDLVTSRRDGSEEISFACEVGVWGVGSPCAACYLAQ